MRNTLAEFVTTGVATLPPFMLVTTGSMEVFAVTVLVMTGVLVTTAAALSTSPRADEEEQEKKEDE